MSYIDIDEQLAKIDQQLEAHYGRRMGKRLKTKLLIFSDDIFEEEVDLLSCRYGVNVRTKNLR